MINNISNRIISDNNLYNIFSHLAAGYIGTNIGISFSRKQANPNTTNIYDHIVNFFAGSFKHPQVNSMSNTSGLITGFIGAAPIAFRIFNTIKPVVSLSKPVELALIAITGVSFALFAYRGHKPTKTKVQIIKEDSNNQEFGIS